MGIHLQLLVCVSILLILCDQSSGCRRGTETECEKAPFVPGYNLAGEGFDVVKLQRKGAYLINVTSHLLDNRTCTVCKNHFQGGQMQKLPLSIVDWRPLSSCNKQFSSALHHSIDSLIKSSASLMNNDWGVDLNLDNLGKAVLGGSDSNIAKFAQSQHKMDKMTFALHEVTCTYYSYRVMDHPELSAEFTKHLLQLTRPYSEKTKSQYQRIIDVYGTHYIRHVQLGGRVRQVTAFRTCLATLKGFFESEINSCLNIEFKIALGFLPANALFSNKCSTILKDSMSLGFHQSFLTQKKEVLGGERYFSHLLFSQSTANVYESWMNSLHDKPVIISYAIYPLHYLVTDPDRSANLQRAVTDYIKENMLPLKQNQNHDCKPTPNLDHNCCPLRAGHGTLRVVVQRATGLNSDFWTQTDGFVKVWYNDVYRETNIVMDNDNPEWYITYDFGSIEFGHALIFEVWDSDVKYDDLIGRCVVYPKQGYHSSSCGLTSGVFYFTYIAQCDAHLDGHRCGQYSPKA